MPTTIATLGRERTLTTLARRVYRIEGRGSTEAQRRAEAALLAANPRLATAEGFRTGESVVVPAVPGLSRSNEVRAADANGEGLTAEAMLRFQALRGLVEDRLRRAADKRRETFERLDDGQFLAEARAALPESVERLEKTRERLKQEEREEAQLSERFRGAVAAALEGVKAIDATARKARPR